MTKATIEVHDAKQMIETPHGKVIFHPDDRGFAFITCKIANNELKEKISQLREKMK